LGKWWGTEEMFVSEIACVKATEWSNRADMEMFVGQTESENTQSSPHGYNRGFLL